MFAWIVLVLSGMVECVWAAALARSEGLTRLVPMLIFFASCAVSMGGLGWALRSIPVGTGYAVWVSVGMVTTLVWSVCSGAESLSPAKIVCVTLIIAGAVGLKLLSAPTAGH